MQDESLTTLDGMYSDYFLDYASYVILERAVPHLGDGLKPVQRRILHSLKEKDDGRYSKVANIVGHTMQYHPHGDAAIGDAFIGLGQKELLIDTQGNWGNTLTGDRAAAPRYIEARLTPFAKEVSFNPKTTEWTVSYDGRNKEPVTLPMKFPLLLAQGVEGIAVGLACKILPHNFIELIDASICHLRKQPFELHPDFPTGGIADTSDYRDGLRGGKVRVRAKIEIEKGRILRITDVPFGVTTSSLQDSIVAANEKGKIKITHVDDLTAERADIQVTLPTGSDMEATRDALYAFTDCGVTISPNACIIADGKPQFIGVSEILRRNTDETKELLKLELEIALRELHDKWHFCSLEKIFIENRIYRDIEESETWEAVLKAIDEGLDPFKSMLRREVVEDDLVRLTEIKIKRISKFDAFKADEEVKRLEGDIEETEKNLRNLTRYCIRYFENLKKKFGKDKERMTELSTFERVDRTMVALATEVLYLDAKLGFAGYSTSLKKEGEDLGKCSKLDDIIWITTGGVLSVDKVGEKTFVGKNPTHVALFKKDQPKYYCVIYRDGRDGYFYAKRFQIGGITRGKEYDLTLGKAGSRIMHFMTFDSEEESSAHSVTINFKSGLGLRNLNRQFNFGEIAVKGRGVKGNIVAKNSVASITRGQKAEEEAQAENAEDTVAPDETAS